MHDSTLIGKRFCKLVVIGPAPSRGPTHKSSYWLCQCDCGGITEVARSNLKRGENGKRGGVKSCGCLLIQPTGPDSEHWVGVGELPNTLFSKIRRHAKRRKIHFALTIEYLWDLFIKQTRQCALSGLTLTFPSNCQDMRKGNFTASLDRIDSSKGYIVDNVQWLHKDVNMMKQQYSVDYFVKMCQLVTQRNIK